LLPKILKHFSVLISLIGFPSENKPEFGLIGCKLVFSYIRGIVWLKRDEFGFELNNPGTKPFEVTKLSEVF